MKWELSLAIILFYLFFSNCTSPKKYNFQGIWQSLNDPKFAIMMNEDGTYNIMRNGESIYEDVEGISELKVTIENKEDRWYTFTARDKKSNLVHQRGRIETVNDNRIRFYVHKHHDILDVADEYQRVDDFESFYEIMEEIKRQPEQSLN